MSVVKLPAIQFGFENSAIHQGISVGEIVLSDHGKFSINPRYVVLGYCEASNLSFRPADGYALMVHDEDGDIFWFHIYEDEFKALI
jgi:hypothetical protein